MAGNLVSLISCQGKGRGPRQPEARPDTGREFFISKWQKQGMCVCKKCKTHIFKKDVVHELCPFCHKERKRKES